MSIIRTLTIFFMVHSYVTADAQIKPYAGSKKAPNPAYSEHYTADGSQVTESEAFMAAIKGSKVYRCVLQEASMGKSGKSASLKNVPKNQ